MQLLFDENRVCEEIEKGKEYIKQKSPKVAQFSVKFQGNLCMFDKSDACNGNR